MIFLGALRPPPMRTPASGGSAFAAPKGVTEKTRGCDGAPDRIVKRARPKNRPNTGTRRPRARRRPRAGFEFQAQCRLERRRAQFLGTAHDRARCDVTCRTDGDVDENGAADAFLDRVLRIFRVDLVDLLTPFDRLRASRAC